MYDIKETSFPNIFPYFIKSEQFPSVGIEPAQADRNLAMLQKVIKMAGARGIKISLMNYFMGWEEGRFLRKSPYQATEENLVSYNSECVKKLLRACPNLAMIGFRVGESGREEDFYTKTYIPAIKEAGGNIGVYSRSWGAKKPIILQIAKEFPGRTSVEIKYNGEQYGPPYMVAGGKMSTWRDYSYQNYLTYPRPYKLIWQIRFNGTHRVFTWGNPNLVRTTVKNCKIGGGDAFSLEQINTYYPAYNYLHSENSDGSWYKWTYQRDWMFYDVWGRIAYNPEVGDRLWKWKFKQRYGRNSGTALYSAFDAACRIVPSIFTFTGRHPDHRGYAVELDTGGDVKQWADSGPFDTANLQSAWEYADGIIGGKPSARMSPIQAAKELEQLSRKTLAGLADLKNAKNSNAEARALSVDLEMLSNLGLYNASMLKSSAFFALYSRSHDPEFADAVQKQHTAAESYWQRLADLGQANYIPFIDSLRKGTEHYTWSTEAAYLKDQLKPLDDEIKHGGTPMGFKLSAIEPHGDKTGPNIDVRKSTLTPASDGCKNLKIVAKVHDPAGVKLVILKWKPLPSESNWRIATMQYENGLWVTNLTVRPYGIMWAIETLDADGNGTKWPDFRKEIPYKWVEPWYEPCCVGQDMTNALNDVAANFSKYKEIFIGRNAYSFNALSPDTKAKLLDAVDKGLLLYIDCQSPDKFDYSWLPGGVQLNGQTSDKLVIDRREPLFNRVSLETLIAHAAITKGNFTAQEGWQLLGEPKAVAIRRYGQGYIVLSQIQMFERPIGWVSIEVLSDLERIMSNIICLARKDEADKPILILDQGEGTIVDILTGQNEKYVLCN